VKVGIIGLTTPQTPTTTLPINVASLRFGQLAPEAMLASNRLRARGAEVVIAVVHAGGKCGDTEHPRDTSSCDLDSGEIFVMLEGLPTGNLDAVVAGHTHQKVNHFVAGVPVVESWALGRYFGTIDLFLDPVTHRVLQDQTAIIAGRPICETMDAATGSCDPRALKNAARVSSPPRRRASSSCSTASLGSPARRHWVATMRTRALWATSSPTACGRSRRLTWRSLTLAACARIWGQASSPTVRCTR
jgi:5'-nucleotidase